MKKLPSLALAASLFLAGWSLGTEFNIRDYGARGDGITVDSPAINAAIEAAAAAGGGTVKVPAGTYLCFSIRLRSHLTLQLDSGAVILAATPSESLGQYDSPEPNRWGDELRYQDFGHSHWHNSLIWGEGLEDLAIIGPGRIDGAGLIRSEGRRDRAEIDGLGNKAIALKECRNVTLRGFSVLNGGHFALLATGVDNLHISDLRIDTNRDGLDIDACRNVRIHGCSINAPKDDAIVLKASYALGEIRHCELITISDCLVSGFDVGTLLDGTFGETLTHAPDRDGPTGRIKIGTESNGDFRDISITNCIFRRSRGLAIESVDGGVIEDLVVSNLVMDDVSNAPIFLRLGNRARGPEGTGAGAIRRVRLSAISVRGADGRFPVTLVGIPGHPIEDVTLEGIRVVSEGGVSLAQVTAQSEELVNPFFLRGDEPGITGPRNPFAVPERITAYPEPSMFGLLPASVLFARHVRDLTIRDFRATFLHPDDRPAVVLHETRGTVFENLDVRHSAGNLFTLREASDVTIRHCPGTPDRHLENSEQKEL